MSSGSLWLAGGTRNPSACTGRQDAIVRYSRWASQPAGPRSLAGPRRKCLGGHERRIEPAWKATGLSRRLLTAAMTWTCVAFLRTAKGTFGWARTAVSIVFGMTRLGCTAAPKALPSDQPIVVHQDRKGQIWVGYHNSGLVEFREKGYRVYTTRDGLASDEIFAIREARNGDLLISTREGLSRMHDGHFSNLVLPGPLAHRQVFDALEDGRGRIWLAAPSGVFRMTEERIPKRRSRGGPLENWAGMLSEGLDGIIWAGTLGAGFWRIKDGDVRRFSTADGLGDDQVRSLYQDPDGTLWIGTLDGGLSAYRDGAFVVYTAKERIAERQRVTYRRRSQGIALAQHDARDLARFEATASRIRRRPH